MGKGMRAGKKPSMGGGGGSMQKQLQQMQAMQRRMEALQAEIEEKEMTTTAGGGAVTVTVNGKKEITKLELKPEIVDPDDIEMLQDLIMVAVNEGIRQIEEMANAEMGRASAVRLHSGWLSIFCLWMKGK